MTKTGENLPAAYVTPTGARGRRVMFMARHLDSGGVTSGMATLGRALIDRGWMVAIGSGGHKPGHFMTPDWFKAQGIEHYHVSFPRHQNGLRDYPRLFVRAISELHRAVDDFQPDVVHVHWRSTSPFAQYLALVRGIPFIASLRAEDIPSSPGLRALSFWGNPTIAISAETKAHLIHRFGIGEGRIRVIYDGVDSAYYRPPSPKERCEAREEFGLEDSDFVVCMVARNVALKRHDVLIRAISELMARGIDISVLCAGAGDPRSLEALAEDYGVIDKIRFLGFRDVRRVHWASDVLALPSETEGFATAVVEGMQSGLVPIRTPTGGAYDQIADGVSGFIVPIGDHVVMADRLETLVRSPERLKTMSRAARAGAVSLFSIEKMIDKTLDVYREAMAYSPSHLRVLRRAVSAEASRQQST